MSVKPLYLVAVAAILGCAPASSTSGTSRASAVPRSRNLLTAQEIVAANADFATAYEAVARLRPNWLSSHGVSSVNRQGTDPGVAIVFVNGQHYGDVNSLRNIQAPQVADIRYYNETESGAKFGLRGGTNGVIEVRLK